MINLIGAFTAALFDGNQADLQNFARGIAANANASTQGWRSKLPTIPTWNRVQNDLNGDFRGLMVKHANGLLPPGLLVPPYFYDAGVGIYLDVVDIASKFGARCIERLAKRNHERNDQDADFYNKALWVNKFALHSTASALYIGVTLMLGTFGAVVRTGHIACLTFNRITTKYDVEYQTKKALPLLTNVVPVAGLAAVGLFSGHLVVLNIAALAITTLAGVDITRPILG